jgi:glutamate/tyrosine decarboxylase-like PLP-dependent enzyme
LSFLLVRDRAVLDVLRPAGDRGSYLFQGSDDGPDEGLAPRAEDLGLTSVYCGKPFLSLALWMLWKSLGAQGLRAHVDRARAMALRFAERVAATGLFELTHETDTWAVCFRPVPEEGSDVATRDTFSNRVHDAVNADGAWMIRLCPAQGGRVFRAIFTNPLMTDEVADRFVAALVAAHSQAVQENPA